jgi:hypothetical protein
MASAFDLRSGNMATASPPNRALLLLHDFSSRLLILHDFRSGV